MSKEIRKDLTMAFCQMFPNPNSSTRDKPHHTSLVFFLDVAAAAPAVARAGAAGVVAVTRSVDFALNDDTVVAVVAVHKEGQDGCDEEEDDVPAQTLASGSLKISESRTYMIPNAHEALSMAHWRLVSTPNPVPLTVKRPKSVL